MLLDEESKACHNTISLPDKLTDTKAMPVTVLMVKRGEPDAAFAFASATVIRNRQC